MCQQGTFGPIDLANSQRNVLSGIPKGFAVSDLYPNTVRMETIVTDILGYINLPRQSVVFAVIRLKVESHYLVFLSPDFN